jgi:hypothetical protein
VRPPNKTTATPSAADSCLFWGRWGWQGSNASEKSCYDARLFPGFVSAGMQERLDLEAWSCTMAA